MEKTSKALNIISIIASIIIALFIIGDRAFSPISKQNELIKEQNKKIEEFIKAAEEINDQSTLERGQLESRIHKIEAAAWDKWPELRAYLTNPDKYSLSAIEKKKRCIYGCHDWNREKITRYEANFSYNSHSSNINSNHSNHTAQNNNPGTR